MPIIFLKSSVAFLEVEIVILWLLSWGFLLVFHLFLRIVHVGNLLRACSVLGLFVIPYPEIQFGENKKKEGILSQTIVLTTLWCQTRTARSLLGPVVKCPRACGPYFSLFVPCDFYSAHVFHFNTPGFFIETTFFKNVTSRLLLL